MDLAHVILAGGLVLLGLLALRYRRRLRATEQLLEDFASGEKPGARAWIASPKLAALLEEAFEARESTRQSEMSGALNLEMVLSSMAEGVMVTDMHQTIRVVNRSFCEMFQLTADPVDSSVISALREAVVEELVRTTLGQGEMQSREIAVLSSADSTLRHLSVNALPVRNEAGEGTGAVFVFHDITQIRQLETVRREFVSNVSHELRTPLSIFQGYVENLLEDPQMPVAERCEIYAIMRKHSQRLNALLEDLLTLARLEARRITFEPVDLDLPAFLEDIADDWRDRLAEQEICLELVAPTALPSLRGDPLRLQQVLNNLLGNAEKFTSSGGRIMVRAQQVDGGIEVSVEDDGQGIPSKDLPHIFERFYRVEKARSRETGGTGLGLSIVKHIVALHGGTVSARSQLGKGTTITARFPLA